MALEWKTIPYSDEVAPAAHDHVEADITDLAHDAVSLQGNTVSNATPSDGDALLWNTTAEQWEPGEVVGSGAHTHAGADITSAVANATDADTLDGEHASAFADAAHAHASDYAPITHGHAGADITSAVANATDADTLDGEHASAFADAAHAHASDYAPITHAHAGADITSAVANATDADTLDGEHASAFADAAHAHASDYAPITHAHAGADITSAVANATDADTLDGEHASAFADAAHTHAGADITSAVANATDADTLDGEHASAFADAAHTHASDYAPFTHAHAGADITSAVANATDADTLDGEHASAFAATEHTHVEADITDLSHNATSIQGYGVSTAAPSDGDTYVWNALAALWTPGESTGTGGGGTLASLLDVGITATPDDNQMLAFKTGAGQWRAMSLPAAPSTARVREFDFQAEYPGAIIDPATLGDGLLEAFADAGHNAYEWTVISASEQSAYLYLRWRLPPGFTSFASGLKVTSKVSNVAKNCGVEVLGLYDGAGSNAIAYVTFKNVDWTEDSINLVAGTFTAGDTVLAKLRLFGQDTSVTYLAGIRIQYNGD